MTELLELGLVVNLMVVRRYENNSNLVLRRYVFGYG